MTKFKNVLVYLFLIVVSLLSIFPFYWMASAATNLSLDVIRGRLLPGPNLLINVHNFLNREKAV